MNTYKLVISTPDGSVFEDEAALLIVRGTEGELAVMAGHIPFITAVKSCECKITAWCSPCIYRSGNTFPQGEGLC